MSLALIDKYEWILALIYCAGEIMHKVSLAQLTFFTPSKIHRMLMRDG